MEGNTRIVASNLDQASWLFLLRCGKMLELSCCRKQQNRGLINFLNDTKLILNE